MMYEYGFGQHSDASWRSAPAATAGMSETLPPLASGALDTLGSLFQTLGEESFPLDSDTDPHEFPAQCREIVRHIEHGAAAPSAGLEPDAGSRQWSALRRFFANRRRREKAFVSGRLNDYRGIVEHFIVGMKQICGQNESTEQVVNDTLLAIEAAIEKGLVEDVKTVLGTAFHDVGEAFARQRASYEEQILALNERISMLHEDLVSVQEEMQVDSLTGLYNRRAFDAAIQHYINTAFVARKPVVLIMIDVDHFKSINDSHGHPVGDHVLQTVARHLSRCFVRRNDFVARYGGDEFAVILPDTNNDEASAPISRLLDGLRATGIDVDLGERNAALEDETAARESAQVSIACSVGCAEIQHEDDVEAVINRADQALYEAKRAGRDCFRTA